MKSSLRLRAQELGFDDCRITTARAPDHAAQFQHWLERGYHGEMGWLAANAHKRVNPDAVLAGARSLITLAASYDRAPARLPEPAAAPRQRRARHRPVPNALARAWCAR